ncbi:hypothetical protein OKW27_000548 [Paraburkholderia sp. 35.1]
MATRQNTETVKWWHCLRLIVVQSTTHTLARWQTLVLAKVLPACEHAITRTITGRTSATRRETGFAFVVTILRHAWGCRGTAMFYNDGRSVRNYSGSFRSAPADAVARASHAHVLWKNALKNTVQRLGEPGDHTFDVMQFVQPK